MGVYLKIKFEVEVTIEEGTKGYYAEAFAAIPFEDGNAYFYATEYSPDKWRAVAFSLNEFSKSILEYSGKKPKRKKN